MKYIQDIIGKTVVIASGSLAQTATVTINLNETHQTIDGFGAAQFGWDPTTQMPPSHSPLGPSRIVVSLWT